MTRTLFSTTPKLTLDAQVARIRALPPLGIFTAATVAFVCAFARRIQQLPELRQYPELATLAHWFRPAAVEHLSRMVSAQPDEIILSRGLAFHMAPANVDVLFAYTWLLSTLAGNANIARLSQRPSPQREALVAILQALHAEDGHSDVLDRIVLVTYPHDDAITASISAQCHARIIWGGDQTVARIRAIPLAPLAIERAFPDRFGVAAFNAQAFVQVTNDELHELARRFCNDTLWFAQQACSSPRTLYWFGDETTVDQARSRFWPQVFQAATHHLDEPAALMARITDAHLMAAGDASLRLVGQLDAFPLRLIAPRADDQLREQQSGYGLVVEVVMERLDELADQLDDRDQTLVQYGFTAIELRQLLSTLGNRAIDRVVPLGRALDFHRVWDGSDLFDVLTRRVTCPVQ